MQIPGNPLPAGLGFPNQLQAGDNRQIGSERQAKAAAKAPAPRATPQALAASLSRAENLEQAVRALSDQGRLPPRGSLIDLSA